MNYHHVYPVNDLIEHEVDSHDPPCKCNPEFRYDYDNDFCIVVHSAMDRRECFE